jgi:tRNA threonylcarbamoyladenosine biosynthesis protein TsaE
MTATHHLFKVVSRNPEQTQKLGFRLGKLASPGDIFLLVGNLGTGKTCLTQGIANGLDIQEYTHSPSFVLMREYQGRLPLYHVDLYRLDNIGEIVNLGLDEYLEGKGLCVIEWADKGMTVLPQNHLLIKLSHAAENERKFEFEPHGERYKKMIKSLESDYK